MINLSTFRSASFFAALRMLLLLQFKSCPSILSSLTCSCGARLCLLLLLLLLCCASVLLYSLLLLLEVLQESWLRVRCRCCSCRRRYAASSTAVRMSRDWALCCKHTAMWGTHLYCSRHLQQRTAAGCTTCVLIDWSCLSSNVERLKGGTVNCYAPAATRYTPIAQAAEVIAAS